MTPPDAEPPESIPDDVVAALDASSDQQLRAVIHYAQRLLSEHPSLTDAVEQREGEELLRIDDHGGYKTVVVERPGATGDARGPFAYRVQWTPNVDGDGTYRWHYLGRLAADEGGG